MSKRNGFFSGLKKSTKITLVSCGCFTAMTALILIFFMIFPITPSEKIISKFGREIIYKNPDSTSVTTTAVTTTMNNQSSVKSTHTTTRPKTSRTDYQITITSGSGFFMGGRIPTGDYPNEYWTPTTTTSAYAYGYGSEQPATSGYTGSEIPVPTEGGGSTGGGTAVVTPTEGGSSGGGSEIVPPAEGGSSSGGGSEAVSPAEGGSSFTEY